MGEKTEKKELEGKFGKKMAKVAINQAMKNGWIKADKKTVELIKSEGITDDVQEALIKMQANPKADDFDKKLIGDLKKRKLVQIQPIKYYSVEKGINFNPQKIEMESELTSEMLRSETWGDKNWKRMNTKAFGAVPDGGHLHPLLKVRSLFKEILIELGFEEMPTNRFVESSFWNFDVLFQPQQHPARDAHDTFFLKDPASCKDPPKEYCE